MPNTIQASTFPLSAFRGAQLEAILQYLGVFSEEHIESFEFPEPCEGARGVRYNVGRSGRGKKILTTRQHDRIASTVLVFGTTHASSCLNFDSRQRIPKKFINRSRLECRELSSEPLSTYIRKNSRRTISGKRYGFAGFGSNYLAYLGVRRL